MPIPRSDDNDEFRAMGYVAIYAAYVEEQAGECYELLKAHDLELRGDPWQVSRRLGSCVRAIRALPEHPEWAGLRERFQEAQRLLEERNIAIHSPLYAQIGGGNVRRAREAADANAYTTAASIYALADALFAVQGELLAAAVRLPRFIREALA